MKQECGTFKNVTSRPCELLLLNLAMSARGAPLTKFDGKIGE
jgi:hypothetical protein